MFSLEALSSDICNLCCSVEERDRLLEDVQQLAEHILLRVSSSVSQKQNGILKYFKWTYIVIYGIYAFDFRMDLVHIKTAFLWNVISCSLVNGINVPEKIAAFIFWEENSDWGTRFLQNVATICQAARRHIQVTALLKLNAVRALNRKFFS
jgi:hypothetical protein